MLLDPASHGKHRISIKLRSFPYAKQKSNAIAAMMLYGPGYLDRVVQVFVTIDPALRGSAVADDYLDPVKHGLSAIFRPKPDALDARLAVEHELRHLVQLTWRNIRTLAMRKAPGRFSFGFPGKKAETRVPAHRDLDAAYKDYAAHTLRDIEFWTDLTEEAEMFVKRNRPNIPYMTRRGFNTLVRDWIASSTLFRAAKSYPARYRKAVSEFTRAVVDWSGIEKKPEIKQVGLRWQVEGDPVIYGSRAKVKQALLQRERKKSRKLANPMSEETLQLREIAKAARKASNKAMEDYKNKRISFDTYYEAMRKDRLANEAYYARLARDDV